MEDRLAALRGGVVLAEMGGYSDGPYVARHGAGGSMVLLGTYIVDAGGDVPYLEHFVFPPGRSSFDGYLREHVALARTSGAKVYVSVVSVALEDTLDFLQAAEDAGADGVSYCAHSTMEMFTSRGLSSVLCHRERWEELQRWTRAMARAVSVPVMFKMRGRSVEETTGVVRVLVDAGVGAVHVDVGGTSPGSEGLSLITALRGTCPLLVAGGGVADEAGARRVIDAGGDAVSVATAAMGDAGLVHRLQAALHRYKT